MRRGIISVLFILLIHIGCSDQRVVYENFHSLPMERWRRSDTILFEPIITEPGEYRIDLMLRHTIDYNYANISFCIEWIFDQHRLYKDTLDMILTEESGKWIGEGSNSLKTLSAPILRVHHIDSIGRYTIKVHHRMSKERLEGVKDIGVTIYHDDF